MDSVTRNVADLSNDERYVFENALGQPLRNDQQIIVQLVSSGAGKVAPTSSNGAGDVVARYEIWSDLSDESIADLESVILQRSDSREN
jgi:hypothetical protein